MNVLYVTHTTDLSGANRSMIQLIRELRQGYGVTPFVVFPKIDIELGISIKDVCLNENIAFLEHQVTNFKKKKPLSIIKRIYYIIFNTFYILHIYWLLRKRSFDLVHTNSSVNDTGAYLAKLFKCPHIWHLREYGDLDFGLYSLLGPKYEEFVYKKADVFIAISKSIKNHFENVIDPFKIKLIYNGIKSEKGSMLSKHESEKLQLCMVGRVEENKNQLEALKAVAFLIKEKILAFHLTIIGRGNEEYRMQLNRYIIENDLEAFVDIIGPRNDVPKILSCMDVGLMLSTSEAFGRVTIEFMMQNLAVVATKAGANEELIQDGKTGFLYSLGNVTELAHILKELISNRPLVSEISQNGLVYAQNTFTSEINSNKIADLYKSLVC